LFVATQAAVRHMGEGGRVINIGSVNADRMPFAGGQERIVDLKQPEPTKRISLRPK
jgi:NAD(P)-dependent dehydrogenase (short-subunit alcohol dehydrogenase family)